MRRIVNKMSNKRKKQKSINEDKLYQKLHYRLCLDIYKDLMRELHYIEIIGFESEYIVIDNMVKRLNKILTNYFNKIKEETKGHRKVLEDFVLGSLTGASINRKKIVMNELKSKVDDIGAILNIFERYRPDKIRPISTRFAMERPQTFEENKESINRITVENIGILSILRQYFSGFYGAYDKAIKVL